MSLVESTEHVHTSVSAADRKALAAELKAAKSGKPSSGAISPTDARLEYERLVEHGKPGDSVSVCCPAHDDHRPSLELRVNDKQRTTWRCYAGCAFDAVAESLAESIYDYRDADGNLVFQVLRLPGKDFRQRQPDGKSWLWKMSGVDKVLYRLPELLAADPSQPVFVCEGEKDVENLRVLGMTATCNPMGAGKWRTEYNKHLAGRHVVVLPDNDDAGREHAEKVAISLRGVAASIKVVALPGLPDKGDVSDWLDSGGTAAKLVALAVSTAVWLSTTTSSTTSGLDRHLTCMADVRPTDLEWLWPSRFALGKLSLLFGEPDKGKSLVTLDMAARVSTGRPWPDDPRPQKLGSVILLSAEDDPSDTIRPRLDAAEADLSRIHLLDIGTIEGDLHRIEETLAKLGDVRLIVVDPVSAYWGKGDAHQNTNVRSVMKPLAAMAQKYRTAVVLLTHLPKNRGNGSAMNAATGSGAWVALSRAAWLVAPDKVDAERRLMVSVKNNLARSTGGLAYRLVERGMKGVGVEWEEGTVTTTADELLATEPTSGKKRLSAERWLLDLLASGPVKSDDVKRRAADAGHSWRTVERARSELGIDCKPGGFGEPWLWSLPDTAIEY